tara:strand:- start:278 stop:463 length:186 start_codon:yes stop_codon:yes gene_type:complete
MALDIAATCDLAANGSEQWPGLAVFLTILFSVYIGLDSLLAASVIVRKSSDAENVAYRSNP